MKRVVVPCFFMAMLVAASLGALPAGRTIINPEGAPLYYAFIPLQEVSVIRDTRDFATDRELLLTGIHESADDLRLLAPGGMWRVPTDPGFVVGYFGDGNAAVARRLVAVELGEGNTPVKIVPFAPTGSTGGGAAQYAIERWETPEFSEPIVLDGMNEDWNSYDPLVRFGSMDEAARMEDSVEGRVLSRDEALFWREGGTGIRTLKSVLGSRDWHVALETTEPVESGTFYHFRLFPNRDTASPAGQIVVPVDQRSGPVVFQSPAGRVSLVGQYVRREQFVELSIMRETVESMMPRAFEHEWSVDIASSHGDTITREHFTWGTVFLNEIAGR